jgi:lantibiotic modifying enzyme
MSPTHWRVSRRGLLKMGLVAGSGLPATLLAALDEASRGGMAGTAAAGSPAAVPATAPAAGAAARRWLEAAVRASRFIHSTRVQAAQGLLWLAGPECPDGLAAGSDLYSGSPGVVLFLLELGRVTGDADHLKEAVAGADYLLGTLPAAFDAERDDAGLYTGLAGIGFTLQQVFKATGKEAYRAGAARCRELVRSAARPAGAGVQWGDSNDIIGGAAGIGLFLLEAARELGEPASRETAVRAGLRLIERGIPVQQVQPAGPGSVPGGKAATAANAVAGADRRMAGGNAAPTAGLKWRMDSTFERLMPNFSHGTAGVAFFLATLYRDTGRREFLDAAVAGARYLQAVAESDADVCLIFHDEPDNLHLHYLGWCHGPVGTARLFYQLGRATGDPVWMDWVGRCARGILKSGIPEHQAPGFWNNLGQCCGSAGVAEFFLQLHRLTGDAGHLAFARRVSADLLARAAPAAPGGQGLKWIHAEHRIRPEYVYAQTGFMQGAAGIGMLLLHLDAVERGAPWSFTLPDSPYGVAG